jgi:hypothetical protein
MTHEVHCVQQRAEAARIVVATDGNVRALQGANGAALHDERNRRGEVALIGSRASVDVHAVRQVVRLHDGQTSQRLELAGRIRACTAPVLVDELGVLGGEPILRRSQERIAVTIGDLLLVERLSRGEDAGGERVRVGAVGSVGQRGAVRRVGNAGATGREVTHLGHGLVEVLREGGNHLIAVLGADFVVVLHLVDVGDEHRRDQDVIERDDALVVLDRAAGDFGAGSVVGRSGLTDSRELLPVFASITRSVGLYLHPFDGAL